MTVLFAGSEREALQQGVSGTYFEDGNLAIAPYARGSAGFSGASAYDAVFNDEVTECWFHVRRAYTGFNDYTSSPPIFAMDAANNVVAKLEITIDDNYLLQYWNGAAFVTVGTKILQNANVPQVIDFHIKKGAGDGEVAVYKNGVLHAQATGLNLVSFGDLAKIRMGSRGSDNRWSQVIVTDAAEPTIDWNLWTVVPSANGTDTDGTGTVADVNELNMNTATFVGLSAAGEKRSFVHAAINTEDFIRGVVVAGCMRRVDDTGPQSIRPYLIIEGTRYYGDTFALTIGFLDYEYVWPLSPASGTDWTTDEVNDPTFEMGWEAVA